MLTVYPAKLVITMNPSNPYGEAVLVDGDRILEVGDVESFRPWLEQREHVVDRRFADHVICPGFIDPHLHPTMAAVLLPMEFITALEWRLPWGVVEATTTAKGFDLRLAELAAGEACEPLFTWGFHHLWHGRMSRERINAINATRPIIVWHRSFHELYMNDAALDMCGIEAAAVKAGSQIDYARGHFFENGLGFAISRLNPWILAPERYAHGLQRLKQVVRFGGQTTIGDLAVGLFDFETEWQGLKDVVDREGTPFRVRLVAHGMRLQAGGRSLEAGAEFAEGLMARNTHRLRFGRHIKMFADGAMFSQLAQMLPPGYIDGHHGEWLMVPEALEAAVRVYWQRGFQIHVHVCGDMGLEMTLDVLEKMQSEHPRFNHGFTFEHFGFSNHEQIRRIRALGGQISANVYYLHELSDTYSQSGIGYERASQMARVGSAMAEGINVTFHSDFTMAPAQPLNSAWVAVNRLAHTGEVMCPQECVSAEQALQAVTINAARVLNMADEIGSLHPGKKADFTVLADNPLTCPPGTLRDIKVITTVFEGRISS